MAFPDDQAVQLPALCQVVEDVPLFLIVLLVKDGIPVEGDEIHIILAGCFNRAEPWGERPVFAQYLVEITDSYPLFPFFHPVFIRFMLLSSSTPCPLKNSILYCFVYKNTPQQTKSRSYNITIL